MKRRTFLGGALTSLVAGLLPTSVLETAIGKHRVDILIDEDNIGTMRIDNGKPIHLASLVLRKTYGFKGIKEYGNKLKIADVVYEHNDEATDFRMEIERKSL